jgi:hypothetical protein
MEPEEDVTIDCPYCGEPITVTIDCTAGSQDYIEDCAVCCRPIRLVVAIGADGRPDVTPLTDNN